MSCTLCNIVYGLVGLVAFTLILGWWMNGYFRRRGVKSPTAYFPIIGHMFNSISQRVHFKEYIEDMYNIFPGEKYIGILQFIRPLVILRDIELIKQVTIKDFDHFLDHTSSFGEDADLLFGNSLFSLAGQKWRDMRATLSPAFTSSKMRGMFQFIVDCGQQMSKHFVDEMEEPHNRVRGLIEVDMKDAFTRYTNDVIATSAFGLHVDSFKDKENTFYMMGKNCTDFTGTRFLKFLLFLLSPRTAKFFNVKFLPEDVSNFYRKLVWDTVKYREDGKIVRNDMIQLLMEARKGTLKHDSHKDDTDTGFATVEESSVGKKIVKREWTDDDIVAQAVIFFAAGFETSSTLLCLTSHELALNPQIQKKLQEEIDEVAAGLDGNLTYDALQKMKYMDMVISETLRLWPPSVLTDRKCTTPYDLPPPHANGKELHIEEGNAVWIPIYAIHRDPKYWKNPSVFDPERFSDENKDEIKPFTYLPFGIGPRNCIGSRFALMEAKSVLFHLLHKFDMVTTAKTENPITFKIASINLTAENGFWLGLKPRAKKSM